MKRISTLLAAGLCLLSLAFLASGCSKQAPQAVQRQEVLIGTNLSLTGPGETYCRSTEQGVELARDILNEQGGLLGKEVNLVSVDNHGNADDAATAVQQLATRHVSAIIGPNMTACATAVMQPAEALRIPVVSPACTDPDITVDARSRQVYQYMFRATFIDPYQAQAMGEYAMEDLHVTRTAVLYNGESSYSKGLAEFYRSTIEARGGTVTTFVDLADYDGNLAAALDAVRQDPGQAVYVPLYDKKARELIVLARSSGMTTPLLGADGWNGPALAKSVDPAYLTNLVYTDHYANDVHEETAETFAERYYEKYGEWPDSYAALGYDSLMMIAEAIRRGNSDKPQQIAQELAKTIDFTGATGHIILDSNHDAIKAVFILTFWEGEPALLEKQPAVNIQ